MTVVVGADVSSSKHARVLHLEKGLLKSAMIVGTKVCVTSEAGVDAWGRILACVLCPLGLERTVELVPCRELGIENILAFFNILDELWCSLDERSAPKSGITISKDQQLFRQVSPCNCNNVSKVKSVAIDPDDPISAESTQSVDTLPSMDRGREMRSLRFRRRGALGHRG